MVSGGSEGPIEMGQVALAPLTDLGKNDLVQPRR